MVTIGADGYLTFETVTFTCPLYWNILWYAIGAVFVFLIIVIIALVLIIATYLYIRWYHMRSQTKKGTTDDEYIVEEKFENFIA